MTTLGEKLKELLILRNIYSPDFVNLRTCSKILNSVIIFAYQQVLQVFLRFVNKMLSEESYHIYFMRRKNKLNFWTAFLKFEKKCTSTLSVIEISELLTSRPFLMLKIKFWVNRDIWLVACFHQKAVTHILKSDDTLKSDNFIPVKSVIPHKFYFFEKTYWAYQETTVSKP